MRDVEEKITEYCSRCMADHDHIRLNPIEVCCRECGSAYLNANPSEKVMDNKPETTVDTIDKVLNAKNAEIAMWKKTHVDTCTEHEAAISKLRSEAESAKAAVESQLASVTAERDALRSEQAAIAARVAKEVPQS